MLPLPSRGRGEVGQDVKKMEINRKRENAVEGRESRPRCSGMVERPNVKIRRFFRVEFCKLQV